MTLLQSLTEQYGKDNPILSEEIEFEGYSRVWIYKELNRLCKENKLERFEKGIYYIPSETPLGRSILNPRKVIERKYITNEAGVMGYYSGYTVLNRLNLTDQNSAAIELYTNNASARVRELNVGGQRVIARKARVPIDKKNAAVLCFLEIMNFLSPSECDDEKKNILIEYIRKYGITRSDITKYAPVFPDNAMRTLIESEVIYSVAQ